jgi:ABC-type lipoprotein export system ATPase subunit
MAEMIVVSQSSLGFDKTHAPLLYIDQLAVYESQWTLLHGPSGSGKTTLLAALAGCGHVQSGNVSIYFDSHEMAYMPQSPCLLEGVSVRDNIAMLAMMRSKPMITGINELSEACNMQCNLDQSIEGLSGGERMKVALMRSLLIGPKVFFLDEPSCHWDAYNTRCIMDVLKAYQTSMGMTIVMVSHDTDLLRYADADIDVRTYQILSDHMAV